jgi:hypothetical protein
MFILQAKRHGGLDYTWPELRLLRHSYSRMSAILASQIEGEIKAAEVGGYSSK